MRIAAIAVTAAALMLAGCSSDPGTESPAPTPDSTIVAGGETSTPTPTVGNLDDPLCAAAQESINTSSDLVSRTGDLSEMLQDPAFIESEDPAALNAWGVDMVTLSNDTLTFYDIGVAETSGDPVNEDFATMQGFVTTYTMTLAEAAAAAESPMAFVTEIQETFSDPAVQEAVTGAPAASGRIATYLSTRCDIDL